MQLPGATPRSALLAAWSNAWLAGEVALPEAVARVRGSDDDHAVTRLWVDDLPLEQALARLRADGVERLRVVLPAAGDVVGLPAPGPFTAAALVASEGAMALRPDGTGSGLVPEVTAHGSEYDGTVTTVLWSTYAIELTGPEQGPFLHDAEHDLRRGIVECAQALRDLDVARWRPEVAGALQDLRNEARRGPSDDLPDSFPARARDVLVQARQLAGVLQLAAQDAGGALDTRETAEREQVLRRLAQLVRRARVAAYNAGVSR